MQVCGRRLRLSFLSLLHHRTNAISEALCTHVRRLLPPASPPIPRRADSMSKAILRPPWAGLGFCVGG